MKSNKYDLLRLVRERCEQLPDDVSAGKDLVHAFQRLRETAPDGEEKQVKVIDDLQQKAERVQETHDPAVISDLLRALKTYLDEELREEPENEGPPPGKNQGEEKPMDVLARQEAAEADDFQKYADDAEKDGGGVPDELLEMRRTAAEADEFARYADEEMPGEEAPPPPPPDEEKETGYGQGTLNSYTCEACGHKQEVGMAETDEEEPAEKKDDEMADRIAALEAERVELRQRLREARSGKDRSSSRLVETERRELTLLRIKARQRDMADKAATAIEKAGAEGLIEVRELTKFTESQWPSLLKLAVSASPPRGWTSTKVESAKRSTQPPTALEVFESALSR
jgi:hypothetical protein